MDLILKLPVQDVQAIMRALGRQPHDEVAPLHQEILRQANSQLQPAKPVAEEANAEAVRAA